MPLEYHTETDDGTLRIKLSGEMVYEHLRTAAAGIRKLAEGKQEAILLDLSGVTYISEDGLALLVSMYRIAVSQGTPIYVEGATGKVADRIHRAGLDQLLKPKPASEVQGVAE